MPSEDCLNSLKPDVTAPKNIGMEHGETHIIRDAKKDLSYIVTPNAEQVALQITDAFKKGVHAFTLIGSYGTGKSSFLWALQQTLQNKTHFFGQGFLK